MAPGVRRSEEPTLLAQVVGVVRERPGRTTVLVLGSSMHAAGHASLAAAAGLLARGLAAGSSPADGALASLLPVAGGGRSIDEWAMVLAGFGVIAALLKLAGGALSSWAEARLAGEVADRVRLRVLDDVLALHRLRGPGHGDHGSNISAPVGTRAARLAALTSHVVEVERGVAHGVLAEARAVVQLVPLAALLVVLAPRLAGTAVAALACFGVLAFALRRAFKRAYARASANAAALVHAADEAATHAELWATYGAGPRVRAHVARVGRAIALETARLRVRGSLLSSTSEVLGALALVLALSLAAHGALGVDRAGIAPFAIAFFMAYRPLRELVDARLARARGEEALRAALGRAGEERTTSIAEATPPGPPDAAGWTLAPLVLEDVTTAHGLHAPLSAEVPPGTIAAIVGPTGTGKTTLLRTLLGLDPLVAGDVRYGGRSLASAGVGPRERPFAWVPQDAPIVGESLAINVGLGAPGERVDAPAILAGLGNAALAGELGDDALGTVRPLSGGERQWIAVARALATGLPVLLLDEPTSALDGGSQARLIDAIARLRGKRTVLLVTHRPEPLAIADVVLRIG